MDPAIPVFAFHRVGPRRNCRFTVPLDVFEQYLMVIAEEGYSTLTCSDLVSIVSGRRPAPARACLLTFDDGYADFWVYAMPLLKRHDMRATVFVILERLRNSGGCRSTLEDVSSGDCRSEDLYQLPDIRRINSRCLESEYSPETDHLSWEEAITIARDGFGEVQSHGLDHAVHYISDRLKGFLHPNSHWMARAAAGGDSRLGTPVYEINSALAQPRYADPGPLRDCLATFVERSGGAAFFAEPDWAAILHREFETAREQTASGRVESPDDWRRTATDGLRTCVGALSERLGSVVSCLAWPFGATSPASHDLALEAGFALAFTTRCGGYIPEMHRGGIGRVSLKEHDALEFRAALRRYSSAETIRQELQRVANRASLDIAV